MRNWTLTMMFALAACGTANVDGDPIDVVGDSTVDPDDGMVDPSLLDEDGDGVTAALDCDDGDASVFPGAIETCDGVDNDCDDVVDGPDALGASTWFADGDGDGFGQDANSITACEQPEGYVARADDCDDGDEGRFPGAVETCDGEDEDCDGDIDNGASIDWFADVDGDGYGNIEDVVKRCDAPEGYVDNSGDCDDAEGSINPGAAEICNGIDDDCDALADDESPALVDAPVWYLDGDGDGHGMDGLTLEQCEAPEGYAAFGDDCDDSTAAISPSAEEVCNGADDDCDGSVDPNTSSDAIGWYLDLDGDSYGDGSLAPVLSCELVGGLVDNGDDCDDSDANVSPATLWFVDLDGDGLGAPDVSVPSCSDPSGVFGSSYVKVAGDCDDADAAVGGAPTWFEDGDGDGYGSDLVVAEACEQPDGFVAIAGDCEDADADRSPETLWYADADGDGYGSETAPYTFRGDVVGSCDQPAPGFVLDATDCDDTNVDVSPATTWYADGDGDGFADGSVVVANQCEAPAGSTMELGDCDDADANQSPRTNWYADGDGDGYGAGKVVATSCERPETPGIVTVTNSDDCDDADAGAVPGALWYLDADADGYGDSSTESESCTAPSAAHVNVGGDCDDTNNAHYPDQAWFIDVDADGFGSADESVIACVPPMGWVSNDLDCDDADNQKFPGQTWYADADGDGFGRDTVVFEACEPTVTASLQAGDCDDGNADINPDSAWYADADGDGVLEASASFVQCEDPSSVDQSYSLVGGDDCNDGLDIAFPGAVEYCDGIDTDCDGIADSEFSWVDASWTHRFILDVPRDQAAEGTWVVRQPINLAQVYANAGLDIANFDPTADISVAYMDCDGLGTAEVPAQVIEGWIAPSGSDTFSPGATHTLVMMLDNDMESQASAFTENSVQVGVYFGNDTASAAIDGVPMTVTANGMDNGSIAIDLNPAKGGLIEAFTFNGVELFSQADAVGGNGVYSSGWKMANGETNPTISILSDGPYVGVMQSSGAIPGANIDYTYTYTMVADSNELIVDAEMVATAPVTISQFASQLQGVRAFQVRSSYFESQVAGVLYNEDALDGMDNWLAQAAGGSDYGFGFGYIDGLQPGSYGVNYNSAAHMVLGGGDTYDVIQPGDYTYQAGDTVVKTSFIVAAFEGDFANARPEDVLNAISLPWGSSLDESTMVVEGTGASAAQ